MRRYPRAAAGTRGSRRSAPRNDAERAAVGWACEMTALEAAAERDGGPAHRLGGLRPMLADMAPELQPRQPPHFGFAAE